ncbi:MAG: FAD:protein FMN transferase [Bacteroidales bacterium]|nr:FAD:protein FMN transferase [Bacteroidales bacterium]
MKRTLCILSTLLILLSACHYKTPVRKHIEGQAFGTTYSITCVTEPDDKRPLPHAQIDSLLADLSHTFSIFDTSSIIYRWNAGEDVELNDDFLEVLLFSGGVSLFTEGAFDCTVQPLVQLWGFGKDGVRHTVGEDTLAAVREYVGFQLIDIQGKKVIRKDPRVQLNFNAVAKGYAVDKVADWLVNQGYTNCLVEIGGEVAARGDRNGKNGTDSENGGEAWKVGIQRPTETADGNKESFESMELQDHRAVATSGNYRNYFEEDGVRYTHILDPRTGKPERTNLLSVTVIAPDCAQADAYATAFMVLGYEKSAEIVKQRPELEAWFIIAGDDGKFVMKR